MDLAAKFEQGLDYEPFLEKYADPEQHSRWNALHAEVRLSDTQQELLRGFVREMKVFVTAGTWCGDCVNQCPIFAHFAAENDKLRVRFFDRDEHADLSDELSICGAPRVPAVLFVSEDDVPCGRYGDRTLAKYRQMAADQVGAACPTGLVPPAGTLLESVVQEWLDEFERIQLMLRMSARLRSRHGD